MIERERQKTLFSYFSAFWGTLIIWGWEMMWVGQKDLFRAGWNRIFLFLVLFKNRWHLVSPGSHLFLFGVNQRNEGRPELKISPVWDPKGGKTVLRFSANYYEVFIYFLIYFFIYKFIYLIFYLSIDSFIHSFIYLFEYLFIYLFIFTFLHTNFKY